MFKSKARHYGALGTIYQSIADDNGNPGQKRIANEFQALNKKYTRQLMNSTAKTGSRRGNNKPTFGEHEVAV